MTSRMRSIGQIDLTISQPTERKGPTRARMERGVFLPTGDRRAIYWWLESGRWPHETGQAADFLAILSICGQDVIVDRRDESLLTAHRWGVYDGYVLAGDGRKSGSPLLRLHRLVANACDGKFVDHKNGNGLDNRRDNLRQCEHFENMANRRKIRGRVPYKGVHFNSGRYKAKIMVRGRDIYLGHFDDPRQAARAYDEAALKYFGEFAATNAELLGKEAVA